MLIRKVTRLILLYSSLAKKTEFKLSFDNVAKRVAKGQKRRFGPVGPLVRSTDIGDPRGHMSRRLPSGRFLFTVVIDIIYMKLLRVYDALGSNGAHGSCDPHGTPTD